MFSVESMDLEDANFQPEYLTSTFSDVIYNYVESFLVDINFCRNSP